MKLTITLKVKYTLQETSYSLVKNQNLFNDLFSQRYTLWFFSRLKLLRGQGALENTRIKYASICRETDEITDSLIFVDKNKEENIRVITSCLEKPIHQMLQNWSTYLETKGLGKHTSRVIAEIKAIGKQLVLEESKRTAAVSDTPCMKCKSIVPGDIKNYLFG